MPQSILSSGAAGLESITVKSGGVPPADATSIRPATPESVGSAFPADAAASATEPVVIPAGPPPAAIPVANLPPAHAATGEPTPRAAVAAAAADAMRGMPRAAEPDRDLVGTPAWRGGDGAGFGTGGFGNGAGGFFGAGGGAGFGGAAHRPPAPSPALAGPFAAGTAEAPWAGRVSAVEPSWPAAARPAGGKEAAYGAEGEDYPNGGGPMRASRRFDEPGGTAPPFGWRWGEDPAATTAAPAAGCAPAWQPDSRPAPALQELSGWRMLI